MASTNLTDPPIIAQDTSYLMQCPPEILSIIFDPVNVDKNEVVARGPLCSDLRCFYDQQLYHEINIVHARVLTELTIAILSNPHLGKIIKFFTCAYETEDSDQKGVLIVMFRTVVNFMDNVKKIELGTKVPHYGSRHILSNAASYEQLESITSNVAISPTSSLADQLEPLNHLPKLKSIHLRIDAPKFGILEPSDSTTLPAQIKSLEIMTEDFLHPQLLGIAAQLQNLSSLRLGFEGRSTDLNPFLTLLNPAKLHNLTFHLISRNPNLPPFDKINLFLSKCVNLKQLEIGSLPILGPNITQLARLDDLTLMRGCGVNFESIRMLLEAYNPNNRIKPLNLELSLAIAGKVGRYSGFNKDFYLWKEGVEFGIVGGGWKKSRWNFGISSAEAKELVYLAREKSVELIGDIVDALEFDRVYEEAFEKLWKLDNCYE